MVRNPAARLDKTMEKEIKYIYMTMLSPWHSGAFKQLYKFEKKYGVEYINISTESPNNVSWGQAGKIWLYKWIKEKNIRIKNIY